MVLEKKHSIVKVVEKYTANTKTRSKFVLKLKFKSLPKFKVIFCQLFHCQKTCKSYHSGRICVLIVTKFHGKLCRHIVSRSAIFCCPRWRSQQGQICKIFISYNSLNICHRVFQLSSKDAEIYVLLNGEFISHIWPHRQKLTRGHINCFLSVAWIVFMSKFPVWDFRSMLAYGHLLNTFFVSCLNHFSSYQIIIKIAQLTLSLRIRTMTI